jgi:E3 ubiquitin-protein ligase CCNP1IP1
MAQAFRDKNKKLMQTQELYDKLKRKTMMGQMQHAAEDAVDSSFNCVNSLQNVGQGPSLAEDRASLGFNQEIGTTLNQSHKLQPDTQSNGNAYSSQGLNQIYAGTWDKAVGIRGGNRSQILDKRLAAENWTVEVHLTPSTHRQRVGVTSGFGLPNMPSFIPAARSPRHSTNTRVTPGELSSNFRNAGKFPAVGLSSGLKSSHNAASLGEFAVSNTRHGGMDYPDL